MLPTPSTDRNQLTRTVIPLKKLVVNFDLVVNQFHLAVRLSKLRCAVPKLLSFYPCGQGKVLRDGYVATLKLGTVNEYINLFTMIDEL